MRIELKMVGNQISKCDKAITGGLRKSSKLSQKVPNLGKKNPKFLHFYIGLYLDYSGCLNQKKNKNWNEITM